MKIRFHLLLFAAMLFAVSSCSDKSNGPETETPIHSIVQVPGCMGGGKEDGASHDSCFAYTFERDLDISWCVPANCCPDSQRFSLSSSVFNDTIMVTVSDTARKLCRCICSYDVHARYIDLPFDSYVVIVDYDDGIYYREIVHRRR
jgi:hypothetical protein